MAKFSYKAKKSPREIVEGIIEAGSRQAAVDNLIQMGYVPISVVPQSNESFEKAPPHSHKAAAAAKHLRFFGKIRPKELTVFTEQLAGLLKSKVRLLDAINIISEQTENPFLKEIISRIHDEIKDGATLAQSLNKYPNVFPVLYINMIGSGEKGGVLAETLIRLRDFRNKEEDIKAKISLALAYPAFIVIIGVATVFVLLGFVIPKMVPIFDEMGQTLPLLTRILISMSDKLKNYWFWILMVIALAVIILRRRGITKREKAVWDRFKLKLPLLGDFMKKSIWARFCRTLAALLENGIPLFKAIEIAIPTLGNEVFRSELEKVNQDIINGASLEESMKKSLWFSVFMTNMIAVGERGRSLETSLLEVADFYERQTDKTTKVITSLLEPVIILIMGLAIGIVVFAMLLPIFQMSLGV